MQFKHTVAALIASLPLIAAAQTSVTIYGITDASVAIEDYDAPGTGKVVALNSGNQSGSRLGFRGTEDLGAA